MSAAQILVAFTPAIGIGWAFLLFVIGTKIADRRAERRLKAAKV